MVMNNAVEKRAETLPVPADEDIFPCFGNVELRDAAYRQYMVTEKTLEEVAESISVPPVTVMRWAANGNWDRERDRHEAVHIRDLRGRLKMWRARERDRVARAQVALGGKIREAASLALDDELTPDGLKKVAEAGKAGADVEARAIGINDAESAAEAGIEGPANGGSRAQPLVIVVPGGGLPPRARERTVTLDDDDAAGV